VFTQSSLVKCYNHLKWNFSSAEAKNSWRFTSTIHTSLPHAILDYCKNRNKIINKIMHMLEHNVSVFL
jgi:hypothetical protein